MSSRFVRGPLVFVNTTVHTAAGDVTCINEAGVIVKKTSGAPTTVTLPASPINGQTVWVKDGKGDASTNRITVVPASGTIDGAANHLIGENFGQRWFTYNGTEWGLNSGAVADVGTVASADGLSVVEMGDGGFHKTVFVFDGYALSTTDNGTAGHGGGDKIYDFPQGHVGILGVSMDWELLTVDGTGLPNDAAIEIGVGTTVATSAMGSLTGTAEDIVLGNALTMSSSLSAVNKYTSSLSLKGIDGSATAKDAYLNLACSAATADGDGTTVLTGTVTVVWTNLGAASA